MFELLPNTWFLSLAFAQTSQIRNIHYKELFSNTDDQELIGLSSALSISFKRMAVGKDHPVQSYEHVKILLNIKSLA